jgi:hypothetical protein
LGLGLKPSSTALPHPLRCLPLPPLLAVLTLLHTIPLLLGSSTQCRLLRPGLFSRLSRIGDLWCSETLANWILQFGLAKNCYRLLCIEPFSKEIKCFLRAS